MLEKGRRVLQMRWAKLQNFADSKEGENRRRRSCNRAADMLSRLNGERKRREFSREKIARGEEKDAARRGYQTSSSMVTCCGLCSCTGRNLCRSNSLQWCALEQGLSIWGSLTLCFFSSFFPLLKRKRRELAQCKRAVRALFRELRAEC